jgi:hypothetical protein
LRANHVILPYPAFEITTLSLDVYIRLDLSPNAAAFLLQQHHSTRLKLSRLPCLFSPFLPFQLALFKLLFIMPPNQKKAAKQANAEKARLARANRLKRASESSLASTMQETTIDDVQQVSEILLT